MATLDHLIFASRDLGAGVDLIEAKTGVRAVAGGPHPGIGTHNALMTFDDETYFEVIAVDPDQPEPSRPRPFRLDEDPGPRLAGFAIHPSGGDTIESLAELMRDGGFDPGEIASMSRQRPDGALIEWALTIGGDWERRSNACLPFVIDWGSTPSPALSAPKVGDLVAAEITHPDTAVLALAERLDVGLVVSEGPARLAARIATANGEVVLESSSG